MREQLAKSIYLVIGVVSLVLGGLYLLSPTFMGYHAEAISRPWDALDASIQILILALMKVAGAGWMATGLAMLFGVWLSFPGGDRRWRWGIPLIGLMFYVPTSAVTLWVTLSTPGTAPWYGSLFAVLLLVIGFCLNPANPLRR
ncbi:MAG: NfeD-like protein [Phormidium sp. OSCR]|nr:MAG: NfeD-like protein [Phormidium sp. OSCR]